MSCWTVREEMNNGAECESYRGMKVLVMTLLCQTCMVVMAEEDFGSYKPTCLREYSRDESDMSLLRPERQVFTNNRILRSKLYHDNRVACSVSCSGVMLQGYGLQYTRPDSSLNNV